MAIDVNLNMTTPVSASDLANVTSTANAAIQAANQAAATANTADNTAQSADTKATQALAAAQTAGQTSDTANTNAAEAKSIAQNAISIAEQAETSAASAAQNAAEANTAAAGAHSSALAAAQAAQAAETAAENAIPKTEKGQPNGVATLDASGKVPAAQLPDDIDATVETNPTLLGDGTAATPLGVRFSADAGNAAKAGADGGVFVEEVTVPEVTYFLTTATVSSTVGNLNTIAVNTLTPSSPAPKRNDIISDGAGTQARITEVIGTSALAITFFVNVGGGVQSVGVVDGELLLTTGGTGANPRIGSAVALKEAVGRANSAYQKPTDGIPSSDIAAGVMPDVSGFYTKPADGIPATDLAQGVQTSLGNADAAYQKPTGGIPEEDLTQDVRNKLALAETSLQDAAEFASAADLAAETSARETADTALSGEIADAEQAAKDHADTAAANALSSANAHTDGRLTDYLTEIEVNDVIGEKLIGVLQDKGQVNTRADLPDEADDFDAYYIVDEEADVYARNRAAGLVWVDFVFTFDLSEYETIEGAQTRAAAVLTTANAYTDAEITALGSAKADTSALTAHTGNTVAHLTAAERTAWNAKQAAITGGASTIATSDLTASRALLSNASGKVAVSAVTSTELGYLTGVTSAIQTQIDSKAPANAALTAETGTTTTTTTGAVASASVQSILQTIWAKIRQVVNALGTKLNLSGGTMTGAIAMGDRKITNLASPTEGTDAANKAYVDNGGSMPRGKIRLRPGETSRNIDAGESPWDGSTVWLIVATGGSAAMGTAVYMWVPRLGTAYGDTAVLLLASTNNMEAYVQFVHADPPTAVQIRSGHPATPQYADGINVVFIPFVGAPPIYP